jgi:hypothetical protein
MAKSTKKQQKHAQKKQKARAEKRREMRHAAQVDRQLSSPFDFPLSGTHAHEKMLRASIQKFAFQKLFNSDIEDALGSYFGEEAVQTRTIEIEEPEMAAFQEWFFFDFVLSNGRHLIDLFAEREGPALPSEQQAILHDWIETNRQRLLEVQSLAPGEGEVVKDLLSGEVLHCHDISMSYTARKWAVILARPLRTGGQWAFTGSGMMLSPLEKAGMVEFASELWRDYQTQHASASLSEFYRDNSLTLREFANDLRNRTANPVYLSAEGHPLVGAVATYELQAHAEVVARLDEGEEFEYVGESESEIDADHYVWLLRGRSQAPATNENLEKSALLLRTQWTAGPGEPAYLTLGDITAARTMLRLECLSRERLASGRQLLEEVLGELIAHRNDSFADFTFDDKQNAALPAKPPLRQTDPNARQVEFELMAHEAERWLNTPVPALDNQSPRQAVRDAAGRAKVEELLKIMEYYESNDEVKQQTPYSAHSLRRELGLT